MKALRKRLNAHFLILLAAFLLLWLLLFSLRPPTWDAVSYYVYARSAVFDGDLHFDNDFRLSYPTATPDFVAKGYDAVLTETGYVVNLFAIGSSVLWLPWLLLLRATTAVLPGAPFTGYEPLFVNTLATFSALLGFIALWLSYRVAAAASGRGAALAAALTLLVATPLLNYQFRVPLYSHTASAFATALCVFVWWRHHTRIGRLWDGLLLGALIGLAALVRWQNAMYLALPLITTLYHGWRRPSRRLSFAGRPWRDALLYLAATGAAALAVFSLQMSVWRVLYGSFITVPQGGSFLDWRAPFLLPLLFSTFRGLLPWMPIFFLALVGLLAIGRTRPALALPLLAVLLLEVYVNASTRDWFAGAGFGPRRFTSELTILVVGYAGFVQLLPRRVRAPLSALLGLALAFHQWVLLRYGLGARIGGRPLSMTPTFRWEDAPLPVFLRDFQELALHAVQHPFDFLVFPESPLDALLRQQSWPADHVSALLLVGGAVALLLGLAYGLSRRISAAVWRPAVLSITVIFLLLANLWILTAA